MRAFVLAVSLALSTTANADNLACPGGYWLDMKDKCHAKTGKRVTPVHCIAAPNPRITFHDPKTGKVVKCWVPGAI